MLQTKFKPDYNEIIIKYVLSDVLRCFRLPKIMIHKRRVKMIRKTPFHTFIFCPIYTFEKPKIKLHQ